MKIDANSYYLSYITRSGEDIACLEHYGNVWDDGYSVDTYILKNKNFFLRMPAILDLILTAKILVLEFRENNFTIG